MKAKYNGKTVYIKFISSDKEYVLVGKYKLKNQGLFKVNILDLTDINLKDLN